MTSATAIVTQELNRIEAITGIRPIGYLEDIAEEAWKKWVEEESDIEAYENEIICEADNYIAHINETYPINQ